MEKIKPSKSSGPSFSMRLLIIGSLGVVMICCFYTYFHESFLDTLLPVAVLFLLACMYASSYFHREKLITPSIYLLPAFCVLSFSIVLISFMFGLHGETIAAYDKCEDKNDGRFKWYNLQDVLQFPMDQLRLKEEVPLECIDFKGLEDTTNICHIVLVDKTKSVTDSDSLINDQLRQPISQAFSVDYFGINTPTVDLVAPFIISCVYNNVQNNSNEALCVFMYDGIKNDFINVRNDYRYTFQASLLSQSHFFETYVKALDSCRRNTERKVTQQRTSINKMMAILEKKLKEVGGLKRNPDKGHAPFQKYKISIISDFINTNPQEKITPISKLMRIDELKTYTLAGSDKQNSSYTADMGVRDLVGDFGNFKGNENIDFTNVRKFQDFCNNLKFSHFKKYNKVGDKTINFHFPYNSYNSNRASVIKIGISDLFEKEVDTGSSRYFIKISDLDDPESTKIYHVGKENSLGKVSEETAHIGELHEIDLHSQDSLFITFPNAAVYANDRLKFEIGSEELSKNLQTGVAFLPSLSRESSLFLIIFYCSLLFAVAFILILPSVFVLVLLGLKRIEADNDWIDNLSLCLPIMIGGVLIFLPFSMYWGIWTVPKLYVLGGLFLFSIPAFFYCLSRKDEIPILHFSALDIFGWRYIKRLNKASQVPAINEDQLEKVVVKSKKSPPHTNGREDRRE